MLKLLGGAGLNICRSEVSCAVSGVVWTCWRTSAASRWSTYSVSLSRSWKPRTRVAVTSSTTLACHMSASTVQLTSRWECRSLPTRHTWRLLIRWSRAKWKPNSTTVVTPMERRWLDRDPYWQTACLWLCPSFSLQHGLCYRQHLWYAAKLAASQATSLTGLFLLWLSTFVQPPYFSFD